MDDDKEVVRPSTPRSGRGLYGHRLVDTEYICVLTRIRMRSARSLIRVLRQFSDVRREATSIPEFSRAVVLVAGPRTVFFLSLWTHERGLLTFGSQVDQHLGAIRTSLRIVRGSGGRPEIWSTQWKLFSASNNLRWGDVDDAETFWPQAANAGGLPADAGRAGHDGL